MSSNHIKLFNLYSEYMIGISNIYWIVWCKIAVYKRLHSVSLEYEFLYSRDEGNQALYVDVTLFARGHSVAKMKHAHVRWRRRCCSKLGSRRSLLMSPSHIANRSVWCQMEVRDGSPIQRRANPISNQFLLTT